METPKFKIGGDGPRNRVPQALLMKAVFFLRDRQLEFEVTRPSYESVAAQIAQAIEHKFTVWNLKAVKKMAGVYWRQPVAKRPRKYKPRRQGPLTRAVVHLYNRLNEPVPADLMELHNAACDVAAKA